MKTLFLVLLAIVLLLILVVFVKIFFGQKTYIKENSYGYDFLKGDYLYKDQDHNISLLCRPAVPYHFRIAFGKKDKIYNSYYNGLVIQNLNVFYTLGSDAIFPKTKLYYGLGVIEEDIRTLLPKTKQLLSN